MPASTTNSKLLTEPLLQVVLTSGKFWITNNSFRTKIYSNHKVFLDYCTHFIHSTVDVSALFGLQGILMLKCPCKFGSGKYISSDPDLEHFFLHFLSGSTTLTSLLVNLCFVYLMLWPKVAISHSQSEKVLYSVSNLSSKEVLGAKRYIIFHLSGGDNYYFVLQRQYGRQQQ